MKRFISGLILGAGASQRLGQPKQLLPFRNTTLLGWVVAQAQRADSIDELVVVLGRAADEIRQSVDFGSAKVVENPLFSEGCSSSYRAGIAALDPKAEAMMIILGDQPGIRPGIIERVADEWRQGQSQIALCSYRGHLGHPMIFGKALFDQLAELHGDKAAWKLIDANPALVQEIHFDLPMPEDINTMSDYGRLDATPESASTN
jgi:molybdenum cofactor cytidylyltransferase